MGLIKFGEKALNKYWLWLLLLFLLTLLLLKVSGINSYKRIKEYSLIIFLVYNIFLAVSVQILNSSLSFQAIISGGQKPVI